jgi:hypothetical protein
MNDAVFVQVATSAQNQKSVSATRLELEQMNDFDEGYTYVTAERSLVTMRAACLSV